MAMDETDRALIEAVYIAFGERDVEAVIALVHPECEFIAVTADHAGHREPYRGHDGVRRYFRDVAEVWDELRVVPGEFRMDGDSILVTGRVSARSPARIVAGSTGWIWRVRDGLVTYLHVYPSAADAMAAFEGRAV
jgi:ketosteroid isomerase-like protein